MKKSLVTLLILTLLVNTLFLGGCGKNGEQSENKNSEKIEFKEFSNDDITFENNERFIKNQLLITAAGQGHFSNHTTLNGKDVAFFFEPSDELYAVARNNKLVVSAEAMRQLNPKLEDIVVRKNN